MQPGMIWAELREQQLRIKSRNVFEKYDRQFITQFIEHLAYYKFSILDAAAINQVDYIALSEDNSLTANLSQLQLALFYHATYIEKISRVLDKTLQNISRSPGISISLDPTKIFGQLPKFDLLYELVSGAIPSYGTFLLELQQQHPLVYHTQNTIIRQAQQEFAVNIFHTLRQLFPQLLAERGLTIHFQDLLHDLIDGAHKNTEHSSQYLNTIAYVKQLTTNTSINTLLKLICAFKLDDKVSNSFTDFIIDKSDQINQDALLRHYTELADLDFIPQFNLSFALTIRDTILAHRIKRYADITKLLEKLESQLPTHPTRSEKILFLIDQISILIPKANDSLLKAKYSSIVDTRMMFDESNSKHILNMIKHNLSNTHEIKMLLNTLQEQLTHTKNCIIAEAQILTTTIIQRCEQAKQYPDYAGLHKAIDQQNIIIAEHTKSFIGLTHSDKIAKQAKKNLRELLTLLRDRVLILIESTPAPEVTLWDTFLTNELDSPLRADRNWQNCLLAFTQLGTQARFAATLADQLLILSKFKMAADCLQKILSNNHGSLPEADKKALIKDKIVGTTHLQSLLQQLKAKECKLNNYILYLQFSAIHAKLTTLSLKTAEIVAMKNYFLSQMLAIKQQALLPDNQLFLPQNNEMQTTLKLMQSLAGDCLQPDVIANFKRLFDFFYGNTQEQIAATTQPSRERVTIKANNFPRKILLTVLKTIHQLIDFLKSNFGKYSAIHPSTVEAANHAQFAQTNITMSHKHFGFTYTCSPTSHKSMPDPALLVSTSGEHAKPLLLHHGPTI